MANERIVRAEIESFKRIKALEITPDGDVIQISGKNEAGKSSVLDAIEAALGGKRRQPKTPIQRGAEGARVVVDLGGLVVERRWTEKTDQLVVTNQEGARYPKPQEKLDGIIGGLAFDPLAFMSEKPARQREILLELAGVDLSSMEDARATIYGQRRDVNRDHKQALARVGERVKGAPKEPVDLDAIRREVEAAMAANQETELARLEARQGQEKAQMEQRFVKEAEEEVRQAEAAVEEAKRRLRGKMRHLDETKVRRDKAMLAAKEATEQVAELRDLDLAPLRQRLADGKAANDLYRAAADRLARKHEAKRLADESETLTGKLSDIDKKKVAALRRAEMPIKGLGVSDDGVTFEGNPLEEESTSRRIRVCTAISAALNPKLKIALVRDGNDLDEDTFRAFAEYCKEAGLQAWVERISPVGDGAVVIEAGEVKS